jgi:hypothetical protein
MKQYTLEDFKTFEKDDKGYIICPSGDYTQIKEFPENCSFGNYCNIGKGCIFGKNCNFGKGCIFDIYCRFGGWCNFGKGCIFDIYCRFGGWCRFGEVCRFGENCSFGENCRFGEGCSFGGWCSFGENCSFGELSTYCLFEFNKLINLNGISKYPIRIYVNTNNKEYYLSIGCQNFGSLGEALEFGKDSYDMSNLIMLENIVNNLFGSVTPKKLNPLMTKISKYLNNILKKKNNN